MLDGVKALFKFTMAILYLAFQVSPPSSCEVFAAIRNTARDLYDIKLLLSIVDQIRLPKESYFAIRRSFYMVQSSFNSDQFYIQTLSNEASRRAASAARPLSLQQQPDTKPPAMTLFGPRARPEQSYGAGANSGPLGGQAAQRSRVLSSANRSKVCVQNLGKMGRSYLKIMDANVRSNERSLMAPLRNCLCIGLSNCGKHLVLARQASRRQFRSFKEQDLSLHVHELPSELFDGFYLEQLGFSVLITHAGELLKLATREPASSAEFGSVTGSAQPTRAEAGQAPRRLRAGGAQSPTAAPCETLMLRDCCTSIGEHEKIKLRQASLDLASNLLWIYVESEEPSKPCELANVPASYSNAQLDPTHRPSYKHNNPFNQRSQQEANKNALLEQLLGKQAQTRQEAAGASAAQPAGASSTTMGAHGPLERAEAPSQLGAANLQLAGAPLRQRKILIIDLISFDIFSAFTIPASFGEISKLRASLVAYFQLANPMSSQFSSRIVQIGPNGHYEQLLCFSDVVDYMVNVPSLRRNLQSEQQQQQQVAAQQRYSSLKRLLTHSISFSSHSSADHPGPPQANQTEASRGGQEGTLSRYYKSLMRSYSTAVEPANGQQQAEASDAEKPNEHSHARNQKADKLIKHNALRSIISSNRAGDFSQLSETNYIPVNMAFIFRNGKIALFEFTETYDIYTRESQLDRYDYSHVLDVVKSGDDFIVTILTVFDKIIKIIV